MSDGRRLRVIPAEYQPPLPASLIVREPLDAEAVPMDVVFVGGGPAGLAGAIELVGGLLIAIGLFASWAAFLASGEMAAAYFMVHAKDSFWPIVNKGELAVLYCFVFLLIASRGGGGYSVGRGRSA